MNSSVAKQTHLTVLPGREGRGGEQMMRVSIKQLSTDGGRQGMTTQDADKKPHPPACLQLTHFNLTLPLQPHNGMNLTMGGGVAPHHQGHGLVTIKTERMRMTVFFFSNIFLPLTFQSMMMLTCTYSVI